MTHNAMPSDSEYSYPEKTVTDFLHRSYTAVDGLWFVKIEERQGFDAALELDQQVWAIMPKIQARKARELLGEEGDRPEALARCFGLKLRSEGHDLDISVENGAVRVCVHYCRWLEIMKRSGRDERLAAQIGERICTTEGAVWAREFGGRYRFSLSQRRCAGDGCCEYLFTPIETAPGEDE